MMLRRERAGQGPPLGAPLGGDRGDSSPWQRSTRLRDNAHELELLQERAT